MNVRIVTGSDASGADWLIAAVTEPAELSGVLKSLDDALGGRLSRLKESGDLTGKFAELVPLRDAAAMGAKRVLLVGLGQSAALTGPRFERAMMTAIRHVTEKKAPSVAVALPDVPNAGGSLTGVSFVETISYASTVGGVGQALYKTEQARFPIEELAILVNAKSAELEQAARRGQILAESVNIVRELVNRPAQDVYPESLAQRAEDLSQDFGLRCGVLDENELKNERMGSLLAVAQGSDRPPRLVVLEYDGGAKGGPRLGLVGKGVTFDSGGLSIKPTEGMLTMKCDMAGAATVLGAMVAAARLKLPVNITGYMGLVENMISGRSYKLGDVLTARSGTTIEVNNTDAEGRLVLADVLDYAVEKGSDALIDLATLTGACVVALGEEISGVFTNNQPWCNQVLEAARRAGEEAWQLPMYDDYKELIKGDVADLKNSGGRWGGAITAAKFLESFVSGKPWVHLDIAGPAFASSSKPHREGGGSGCMVRTLVEVASHFIG